MTDLQEHTEHCKAQNEERKELEDKIKQCDLKSLAMSMSKSEPGEKFWIVYFQRCDLLRRYRERFGEKAHQQLREQLDEARKAYMKKMHIRGLRLNNF